MQEMLLLHLARPSSKNRPHGHKNDDSTPEPHREVTNMGYGYRDEDYFFLKIRAAFPGIPG